VFPAMPRAPWSPFVAVRAVSRARPSITRPSLTAISMRSLSRSSRASASCKARARRSACSTVYIRVHRHAQTRPVFVYSPPNVSSLSGATTPPPTFRTPFDKATHLAMAFLGQKMLSTRSVRPSLAASAFLKKNVRVPVPWRVTSVTLMAAQLLRTSAYLVP
jgi:hypothetical protein